MIQKRERCAWQCISSKLLHDFEILCEERKVGSVGNVRYLASSSKDRPFYLSLSSTEHLFFCRQKCLFNKNCSAQTCDTHAILGTPTAYHWPVVNTLHHVSDLQFLQLALATLVGGMPSPFLFLKKRTPAFSPSAPSFGSTQLHHRADFQIA